MEEQIHHAELEQEIADLTGKIREQGAPERGKEIIREHIGERIYGSEAQFSGKKDAPMPERAPNTPSSSTGPLPAYAKDLPSEIRLITEKLLETAFHEGLNAAIKEVKKCDPLVMDLFHDAITEKLYAEFKKRGILK